MVVHVKKWGNSASVRIPANVMAAAGMHLNQAVEVKEEGGRIVIEPVKAKIYKLDVILAQMTPESFHDEVDFGAPIGHEVW